MGELGEAHRRSLCWERSVSSMNCKKKFNLGSDFAPVGCWVWSAESNPRMFWIIRLQLSIIKIIRNDCCCWFWFEYSSQITTASIDLHLAGHCFVSKTRKCSKYLFYKYQLPVLGGILASHSANANKLYKVLLLYFLIITEICFWCKISTRAF